MIRVVDYGLGNVQAFLTTFQRLGVAADRARSIDGPTDGTIPPYDRAVVLGPTEPDAVAARLKALAG